MVDKETSRGFAADLQHGADEVLSQEVLRRARRRLHVKAIIIAAWYLVAFGGVMLAHGWLEGVVACVALTFGLAGVGFNIQHDANHNAFFDTGGAKRLTRANRIVGWSMFALGADANRWIYRHGTLHHGSPNVVGTDTDIALGIFARVAPEQRWYWWHRGQHIYLWFLYGFSALELLSNDVTALIKESMHARRGGRRVPRVSDYAVVIGTKMAAGVVLIGLPALTHPAWIVAVGAGGVVFGLGLLMAMVFQVAHLVEVSKWHQFLVLFVAQHQLS